MFIKIDPALFDRQSDYLIGVVVAEGVDNLTPNAEIKAFLESAVVSQRQALAGQSAKQIAGFDLYHEAMRSFGINPSRKLMSVEALMTRLLKGDDFPEISPVVDLSNAVSLEYHVPLGAHDIDSLTDDLTIRHVTPDDVFDDPSAPEGSGFDTDEVVYASGGSIRTRRWIWRQMPDGLLSEDVKNIVFPVDGFTANLDTVLAARDALALHLKRFFGCGTRVGLIDKTTPEFQISE